MKRRPPPPPLYYRATGGRLSRFVFKGGPMTRSVARAMHRAHVLLVANCFYPLLMGSLLAGSFLMLRYGFTGSMRYRFLVWNLFLAWIPYGCAVALKYGWLDADQHEETRRKRRGYTGGIAVVAATWLLTFPNAPY